jgi:hypothetical protein
MSSGWVGKLPGELQLEFILACVIGDIDKVMPFLADSRVDPGAGDSWALKAACESGRTHVHVVKALLSHPRAHPTVGAIEAALSGADYYCQDSVVNLLPTFISAQPDLLRWLYRGEVRYKLSGVLRQKLDRWERQSAFVLLLCVKRTQSVTTAARVSDVLWKSVDSFARFPAALRTFEAGARLCRQSSFSH